MLGAMSTILPALRDKRAASGSLSWSVVTTGVYACARVEFEAQQWAFNATVVLAELDEGDRMLHD